VVQATFYGGRVVRRSFPPLPLTYIYILIRFEFGSEYILKLNYSIRTGFLLINALILFGALLKQIKLVILRLHAVNAITSL